MTKIREDNDTNHENALNQWADTERYFNSQFWLFKGISLLCDVTQYTKWTTVFYDFYFYFYDFYLRQQYLLSTQQLQLSPLAIKYIVTTTMWFSKFKLIYFFPTFFFLSSFKGKKVIFSVYITIKFPLWKISRHFLPHMIHLWVGLTPN